MEKSQRPVESMSRFEVIQDLRYYAHPTWYHSLLSWSTPRLKALLVFYREDAKEGTSRNEIRAVGPTILMFGRIEVSEKIGNDIRRK